VCVCLSLVREQELCRNGWTDQNGVCAVDSWGSQRTVYLVAAGSRPEQRDILSVIAYLNILAVDILNLIR